jgi:hypothetical protein
VTTTASYYHLSKQAIGRAQGRSAVAAAAYRTGTSIDCEREGTVCDYTRKSGVVATWTIAPEGAPEWTRQAATLWNAVEAKENRKNSQLAHEIILALPSSLDDAGRETIMEKFGEALRDRYGCAVTIAIHRPSDRGDDRNEHAHVMMTTRRVGAAGWGTKIRELNSLPQVSEEVAYIRELAADLINDALEDAGSDERVDHRSFKARGIDAVPTTHRGPAVTAYEREGVETERGDINRAIIEERLRWQQEQAAPEITDELDREFSQRWEGWQSARPGERRPEGMPDAPGSQAVNAAQGSPAARTEISATPERISPWGNAWRVFADGASAFAEQLYEFIKDETSGTPEAERGFAARVFDAGRKIWSGWHEDNEHQLSEGVMQAARLAVDLVPEKPDGQPKSFVDKVADHARALLQNERGSIPGDDFDRMAAEWAPDAPAGEPGTDAVEPPDMPMPGHDGPEID